MNIIINLFNGVKNMGKYIQHMMNMFIDTTFINKL
jgi:hypothetical protein